jgi:hypothetical protein
VRRPQGQPHPWDIGSAVNGPDICRDSFHGPVNVHGTFNVNGTVHVAVSVGFAGSW